MYAYLFDQNTFHLEKGYPKNKSILFPGIPDRVTAAFLRNDLTYFASTNGDFYSGPTAGHGWVTPVKKNHPPVYELPREIDAVFSWGKHFTYITSGDRFYKVRGKVPVVSIT